MAIFGKDHSKELEYLESEREKLWERLILAEEAIEKKTSDFEKDAKQASKKAAEYRNRTEERSIEALSLLGSITDTLNNVNSIEEEALAIKTKIETKLKQSDDTSDQIVVRSNELLEKLDYLNTFLEEHPHIDEDVQEIASVMESLQVDASKAASTYKGILSKKSEIDELHREIIGYEDKDETGNRVAIEGLKDKLSDTYNSLSDKSDKIEADILELETKSKTDYQNFLDSSNRELDRFRDDATEEYNGIIDKIKSLLPDAMTAGLSSAFIKKKKEEEDLFREYKVKFNRGIIALSLVSLLPISISIYFLASGIPLTEVVERSPKVILSFMPLYIPLIWTTISANKKVNLSKRLIEEYSHKQVLSMTIEGMSTQIENIEDTTVSEELRIQLLRNFLIVTSENPGKLISNYQKSDNPILNILDRDKSTRMPQKKSMLTSESLQTEVEQIVESYKESPEDEHNEDIAN